MGLLSVLLCALIGYCQPSWGVVAFFAATLIWCSFVGTLSLAGRSLRHPMRMSLFGLIVAAAGSLCDADRPREGSHAGIDDAYSYYCVEGSHNPFRHPIEALDGAPGESVRLGLTARQYAAEHGPITFACQALGMAAYYAGPAVYVIDLYGLADPYVARSGAPPGEKTGHVLYDVPEAYLRCRGAINLQPDWIRRLEAGDPLLAADAKEMIESVQWPDEDAHRRWLAVQRIISGPLLARERWREIPAYMFAPRRRIPPWPVGESPGERFGP